MPKKKRGEKKKGKQAVPLARRTILDGRCSFLAPGPITNSGRADGGWMDRVGIEGVGMGYIFQPPNAMGPIDCFYSNDAYARAGFCTMQLELHPPLECIGDESTPESLYEYLEGYMHNTENDSYKAGEYTVNDSVQRTIDDPSSIGSSATTIVQKAFEVPITPGPNIPRNLTATTIVALVHFPGKGNVTFKANNFERHSPPLDYQEMLASISYTHQHAYHGPDPTLSGFQGLEALLGGENVGVALGRAQAMAPGGTEEALNCLKCGLSERADGSELLGCGKCKAPYCSRECQKADWKRHKKTECISK